MNHNTETVRKIDTEGIISTVAGAQNKASVVRGDDSGLALEARLANPAGIAVDTDGVFYIADREHNRILKVDTDGTFTTIAGLRTPGFAGDGGPATEAELFRPAGLALAPDGSIYVADSRNHRIRKIDSEGIITTVAGTGSPGFSGDGGPATGAKLFGVNSLTLDAEGNLYFNDSQESELVPDPQLDPSGNFGNRVRRIDTSGIITTVAGTGEPGFDGDGGHATDAELSRPQGVALDADGNLYIADQDNHRVRKVTR